MMHDVMEKEIVVEPVKSNGLDHEQVAHQEIEELNRNSRRIQSLIEEIEFLPDAHAKELMQECVNEMLTLYGKGLERIMEILFNQNNEAATKVLNELMDDSFISSLLILHDLHPLDLETRINLALEQVRPYIQSHGGKLELLSLENGVAKISLSGTCKSCASSSVTLDLAIKQAIEEACPDLLSLQVEGISPQPHPNKPHQKESRPKWKFVENANEMRNNEVKPVQLNGSEILICKINDQLYAYKNNCPACDLPLENQIVDEHVLQCRLGHRFDISLAGVCINNENMHLDPYPLIRENGTVKLILA